MMNTQTPNPDVDPVTFTITLRPLRSDIPVFVRLRRVLKSLLRTYSFQCTYYTMTPTPIQLGHSGPNAIATLSHTTPPATNSTLEDGSCSSVGTVGITNAVSHAVVAKDCASGIFSCKPVMQRVKMGKGTCQPPSALG